MAQLAINLTDYKSTNIHHAFIECENLLKKQYDNVVIKSTEILGMIPLEAVSVLSIRNFRSSWTLCNWCLLIKGLDRGRTLCSAGVPWRADCGAEGGLGKSFRDFIAW